MRRKLTLLLAATSLALGASVATAGAATAAASDRSVHFFGCGDAYGDHQGKHAGWNRTPSTERRNVGGSCPAPEDPPA